LQTHKATIEAYSVENGGTTFTITFPLATAPDTDEREDDSDMVNMDTRGVAHD
jgi:K+-sensing histidine kinase KdpD